MARNFVNPDRITTAAAPATAYPITLAAWARPTTLSLNQSIIGIGASGESDPSAFMLRISSANILQARAVDAAGSGNQAVSDATFTSGVWAHTAGVFNSDTSRLAYLNGTSSSNTTSRTVTPASFAYSSVGCNPTTAGGFGSFFQGSVAEAAWWAAELTADEIAMLAAGYSPLFVRPAALRAYTPLFGRRGAVGDEEDWVGGLTFSQNSSPALADHPRIIYPRRRSIIPVGAAAASTFIPSWARQNSRVIGGGV